MNRTTALISVRPSDSYVDGASFSGLADKEIYKDAYSHGYNVHTVDHEYAKKVVFTHIAIKGQLQA